MYLLVFTALFGLISFESHVAFGTYVSGNIPPPGVNWDIAGSPYIIMGDILVENGATLTIEPGVEVRFNGSHSLFVEGDIIAIGNTTSRITITSNSSTPLPKDWKSIHINSSGHADFEYCDIFFGTDGVYMDSSSNNTIADCNLSQNNRGLHLFSSSDNVIQNNTMSQNSAYGLYLDVSSDNNLTGNTVMMNNDGGIMIQVLSNGNTVSHNNISSNGIFGIVIISSSDNVAQGNNISEHTIGISLDESSNITLTNNIMVKNGISISGQGILNYWDTHTIDTSNMVNNKPLYYWKDQSGGIIPPGAGQIIIVNCTNMTITNQELNYSTVGVLMFGSSNNTISSNTATNSEYGIQIRHSENVDISGNNIAYNEWGTYLWSTNGTSVDENNASNNTMYGIYSSLSDGINIANNTVVNNLGGIFMALSSHGAVSGNNVSDNINGIVLSSCNDNSISDNLILNNSWGFFLSSTNNHNNSIYHNNVVNNTNQVYLDIATNFNNTWDDGRGKGNYWSDYNGNDDGSGGRTAGDGVGDTGIPHPFVDQGFGYFQLDNFPLIDPLQDHVLLYEGWNLVSIPMIQPDIDIDSVLSSLEGSFDAVQWYNASDMSDPWKHNSTAKPFHLNDLSEIHHIMGFWIHITEPGWEYFQYPGIKPVNNQSIPLLPGWNMVGYPSITDKVRDIALNNLTFGNEVDSIWTFDSAAQTWLELGSSDYYQRGRGYWIHATQECVWEVPL